MAGKEKEKHGINGKQIGDQVCGWWRVVAGGGWKKTYYNYASAGFGPVRPQIAADAAG